MLLTDHRGPSSWSAHGWRRLAYTVGGGILAYLACALALGLVPVNRGFEPSPGGTIVYLRSNGVHAELVLPVVSRAADLRARLPRSPAGMQPATHVSIGWGDRRVYPETRTWADLREWSAVRALLGLNGAVLHVEFVAAPFSEDGLLALALPDRQFTRLAEGVLATFVRNDAGEPVTAQARGYGLRDAFYHAHGRFDAFRTCNEWVRRILADAGVRTAAWSPFQQALYFQARRWKRDAGIMPSGR